MTGASLFAGILLKLRPWRPIPIDLQELATALDSGDSVDIQWYLDLRSGDVILVTPDIVSEFPEYKGIDRKPEIFLPIEQLASHEKFKAMEDFVRSLPDGDCRRILEDALQRKKPFRSFKDALLDFPEQRAAWFEFESAFFRDAAIAFLNGKEINWVEG